MHFGFAQCLIEGCEKFAVFHSEFTLELAYVRILFEDCQHLFQRSLYFVCRTVIRKGKQESIKVNWLSPRLMSLLDYLMHKAPYWSVQNYEKRLKEDVRDTFMRHVCKVHTESREDLTGLRGEF